jgi:hypothetical protein
VVLGIALTGMFPLMVMQSRSLESLELRYTEQGNKKSTWFAPIFSNEPKVSEMIPREDYGDWYFIPSTDPWARKLGAMATLSREEPPAPEATRGDDDNDASIPDYEETGTGWEGETNAQAFHGDRRRHAPLSGGETSFGYAIWSFTISTPGYYQILATWSEATEGKTQASDACYDIYSSTTLLDQVTIQQDVLPDGAVFEGRPWKVLRTEYLETGMLKVQLRGGANVSGTPTTGHVVADAVRIVPVPNRVHIQSLDKSFNSEKVTAFVKVDP